MYLNSHRSNDKTIIYTLKQTRDYEKRVRACYKAVSKDFFDKNTPIEIDIKAYFSAPQNVTNNLKDEFSFEKMYLIKPPALDNITKIVPNFCNIKFGQPVKKV